MDKSNPPTAFGVFKPVGHTLMAFLSEDKLQSAQTALGELGFGPGSMVRYSPSEMKAQVVAELQDASPFASFGYEIDLIRQHKILASKVAVFWWWKPPPTTWLTKWLSWSVMQSPQQSSTTGTS